jgi:hypothetical protein
MRSMTLPSTNAQLLVTSGSVPTGAIAINEVSAKVVRIPTIDSASVGGTNCLISCFTRQLQTSFPGTNSRVIGKKGIFARGKTSNS